MIRNFCAPFKFVRTANEERERLVQNSLINSIYLNTHYKTTLKMRISGRTVTLYGVRLKLISRKKIGVHAGICEQESERDKICLMELQTTHFCCKLNPIKPTSPFLSLLFRITCVTLRCIRSLTVIRRRNFLSTPNAIFTPPPRSYPFLIRVNISCRRITRFVESISTLISGVDVDET